MCFINIILHKAVNKQPRAVRGGRGGADFTSHNKQLSEMAVGGEAAMPPRPCPIALAHATARPIRHVRQAAGRYMPLPLLRCVFISNPLTEA